MTLNILHLYKVIKNSENNGVSIHWTSANNHGLWQKSMFPSVESIFVYCDENNLGFICITDSLEYQVQTALGLMPTWVSVCLPEASTDHYYLMIRK